MNSSSSNNNNKEFTHTHTHTQTHANTRSTLRKNPIITMPIGNWACFLYFHVIAPKRAGNSRIFGA